MSDSSWWFHTQASDGGFNGSRKKTKSEKNRRKKCTGCGHSTTLNQRKSNGDKCHQCEAPFPQITQVIQYS